MQTKADGPIWRRRGRDDNGARLDVLLPRDWPQTDAPLLWHGRSSQGESQSGEGSLEELPSVGSTPVRIWTPATETLLTNVTLPTRSRSKLEQALPYALEEQLLDDPAHLHFAWRREENDALSVAVTAKERLRTWQTTFERAGIKPAALSPATLAVPWSPDCWSAAFVRDELLVRTGPASGFACVASVEQPPALLVASLKEKQATARAPDYFIVFSPPSALRADAWTEALGVPVRVEPQPFWSAPGDSEPVLNLLQGEFAKSGEMRELLRPWLPAAIMVALWIVGTMVFNGIEWWQLHSRHRENVREMETLLLSAFPETKTVIDPMQQMQRSIDLLQARSGMRPQDMLPLLTRAARAWQGDARVRLRSLRYGDRSLTLELTAPDNQTIENLRRALQTNGVQGDLLSTSPRGNEIDGRLRIQAVPQGPKS